MKVRESIVCLCTITRTLTHYCIYTYTTCDRLLIVTSSFASKFILVRAGALFLEKILSRCLVQFRFSFYYYCNDLETHRVRAFAVLCVCFVRVLKVYVNCRLE